MSGNRPNVIVILVDDMGFADMGLMGSEIQTPNIDKLAKNGVTFSSMYNCARCCPTRASLLTGLYPHKAGIGFMAVDFGLPEYQGKLRNDAVTIAEAMRENGYRTLMSGKWHVGGDFEPRDADNWRVGDVDHPSPRQRGFDRFFGMVDGAMSFFHPHHLMEDDSRIEITSDDFYLTDAISDKACDMIEDSVEDEKPFFMYLAYNAPHWPLHAPAEDIARYDMVYRNGWDKIRTARHESMIALGALQNPWEISPRDANARPWEHTENQDWEADRMAVYAAMVDRMDAGVGRVVDCLEKQGVKDNTLILFLSDNGGCAELLAEDGWCKSFPDVLPDGREINSGNRPSLRPGSADTFMSYDLPWANVSNAPFRLYKHWVHEGGISTPMVAHWPDGIETRGFAHTAWHVVDILPTILEITGTPYPSEYGGHPIQDLDGESFAGVFKKEHAQRERPIFWEHEGNSALRIGDWKLVRKHGEDWELHNMIEDRTELNDLSTRHATMREQMIKDYGGWAHNLGVRPWEDVVQMAEARYGRDTDLNGNTK
ncbi:arylsulfatase [Pacificoceanicola onchidii]|uniref:arylsulfatase n=1 Tax=Pacificoceanicola onchidii TaxID=2562685 RepID=UPI0010A5B543|nr:arylsulfatase [Pacificoceanicola onchidii]